MPRPIAWCLALLLLAACHPDTVVSTRDPDVRLVTPRIFGNGPLRVVSPDFARGDGLRAIVDGTVVLDTSRSWSGWIERAGQDTAIVYCSVCWGGPHAIVIELFGVRTPPMSFEVLGMTDNLYMPSLHGWPLAVGSGSSKFWVRAPQGLALLDARYPSLPPVLVDSTVDPACLDAIGAAPGGAVVAADRGCGTLRARSYGATRVEVDSGPPVAPWRYAVNGPPGVWLLAAVDSVALAVRGAGGTWNWSRWPWPSQRAEVDLVLSPDGRFAVAGSVHPWWGRNGGAMVFDLEHQRLLYGDTAAGMAVAFSPSGDTLVYLDGAGLVLLDSRTGSRLAAFPLPNDRWLEPLFSSSPMVWDPFRPWLYIHIAGGLPNITLVDRRSWTFAGSAGHWNDVAAGEGMIAVSGFDQEVWVLYAEQLLDTSYYGVSLGAFAIPPP